tara:strand:+ start:12759 stop:13643 length:885 start_codon:yes stop_codon:yes gene_type:complete
MRNILVLFVFFFSLTISSQELNCRITINYDQVTGSNRQVFETLETTISEFVNQKKWTNKAVKPQERINCAMNIIITQRDNNTFQGSIQIQSTRPIYNTSYESPILNIRDNKFNFKYNEFDQFIYNPTAFDSNLISMITFYVYVILGVDADTFALNGGEAYLRQAENAMLQAQQSGLSAWSNQVGVQNRFQLIDNLLSPNLKQFRSVMYNYHRKGFDVMAENKASAKQVIESNIISLDRLFNKVIGNPLLRSFFDAKSDEIVNLYSDGPNTRSKQRLLVVLQKISPNNSSKWRKI